MRYIFNTEVETFFNQCRYDFPIYVVARKFRQFIPFVMQKSFSLCLWKKVVMYKQALLDTRPPIDFPQLQTNILFVIILHIVLIVICFSILFFFFVLQLGFVFRLLCLCFGGKTFSFSHQQHRRQQPKSTINFIVYESELHCQQSFVVPAAALVVVVLKYLPKMPIL